jgi:hypothetical protein
VLVDQVQLPTLATAKLLITTFDEAHVLTRGEAEKGQSAGERKRNKIAHFAVHAAPLTMRLVLVMTLNNSSCLSWMCISSSRLFGSFKPQISHL